MGSNPTGTTILRMFNAIIVTLAIVGLITVIQFWWGMWNKFRKKMGWYW